MKFCLNAELTFNKTLEGLNLSDLIKSSKEVLKKGAPQGEEAKIVEWKVKKDTLNLKIESGKWVRPHDAVFRLKNFFSQELGKKYKVGVRKIFSPRYEIEFFLEKEPKSEFTIPFIKKIDFQNKKCKLLLENLDEEFLQKNYVDRIISLVQEKVDKQYYEGKSEYHDIIWQSEKKKKYSFKEDPSKVMEERGWIKHRGRGQWIFDVRATKIMKTFERIVEEELLSKLNFQEVIIPKAETWDIWKCSGHAKSIYPEVYFLCPPKSRDREYWDDVIDEYIITGEVPLEKVKERIKEPIGGVTYAQCPSLWPYFQNKTIADESLPIKVFDRSGTSMRYESGGIHGIERVDEFHRIEVVWISYPEEVKKIHEQIVEKFKFIFEKILELEWRMSWVTPWFMSQEGLKGLARGGVGTIDFEAFLPYSKEWLEFQNASNNGEKYPKGFNVKSQKSDKSLYSGCAGIGLERWTASFLAQKGLEPEEWPKEFKKRFGELPKGVRFL